MPEYFAVARQIRAKARAWWYHQDLRRWGNFTEARRREHDSIRSCIRQLREAREAGGFLHIGRGGSTFYYTEDSRVEYCGHDTQWITDAGILTVDTTTVPNEDIWTVGVKWPIVVVQRETRYVRPFAECGSLDYCRIGDMLEHYRAVGATIMNEDAFNLTACEVQ